MTARDWLVLGRVSNLPTVWSNVLCAWLLTAREPSPALALSIGSITAIYLGGMFLNDYCDQAFDRAHNPQRPIPSGRAQPAAVLGWSAGLLGAGLVAGAALGWSVAGITLLLVLTVVIYDVAHKRTGAAPFLMAGCRMLIFPAVAVAVAGGVSGTVWAAALGMFAYIAGLSIAARLSASASPRRFWPALLLLAPVGAAYAGSGGAFGPAAGWTLAGLLLWTGRNFFYLNVVRPPRIDRAIGGLLAGIVLVDLFFVASLGRLNVGILLVFLVLWTASLLSQRKIPAN